MTATASANATGDQTGVKTQNHGQLITPNSFKPTNIESRANHTIVIILVKSSAKVCRLFFVFIFFSKVEIVAISLVGVCRMLFLLNIFPNSPEVENY